MEYLIIILIIAAAMIGAAVVGCFKPGKKENLCKYDQEEDEEK